jgi:hypothetical protein
MARLFEFSDQRWLPRCFRDALTELLQYQASVYRIYEAAIPKLNEALRRSGSREILDLCSGSGGPLLGLKPDLCAERFTLSDRFPPKRPVADAGDGSHVTYLPTPLDARAVPKEMGACRTLFASFHHFGASDARRILASAVEARAPIAIFEFTERQFARMVRLPLAPLLVWTDTWHLRPRRMWRLFWTYLVPVIPLIYTWDAIVSHLRTYSLAEMTALTDGLRGHAWEVGTLPEGAKWRILYLVGVPTA